MKKIISLVCLGALLCSCSGDEEKSVTESNTLLPEPEIEQTVSTDSVNTDNSDNLEANIDQGKKLIAQSDCLTCHKEEEKLIGPAYKDVAEKYSQADKDMLVDKIINGGSGNWGDVAMQPHADTSKEDAQKMVDYILSIQ